MLFVTKLKRQMTKPEAGPQQQGVAAVGPQSLARSFQSLAQGQPGGEVGRGAQCVVHPTIMPPEEEGTNFVKRLKRDAAYTESLAISQGQNVANEVRQLGAGAQLGALVHAGPVGGNLVKLIKQEKLEPVGVAAIVHQWGQGSWWLAIMG